MHDDFIQTMNRICTPIEDPGKKRIVKQVGKNVAMNAAIANENCDESASLMEWTSMTRVLFSFYFFTLSSIIKIEKCVVKKIIITQDDRQRDDWH